MPREILGHLVGVAVYVAGFFWWFTVKNRVEPKTALWQALQLGVVYLVIYILLNRLLEGR